MAEQKELPVINKEAIVPGQIIRIHEKIQEATAKGGTRERIQIFEGLVIGVRGSGESKTFTIRKDTNGFGVEKIFPVNLPAIDKIELVKAYKVRRAKLTFIKDFARRLKEVVVGKKA